MLPICIEPCSIGGIAEAPGVACDGIGMVMPGMFTCASAGTAHAMTTDTLTGIGTNLMRSASEWAHPRTIAEGAFRRSSAIAILAGAGVAATAATSLAAAILPGLLVF